MSEQLLTGCSSWKILQDVNRPKFSVNLMAGSAVSMCRGIENNLCLK